MSDQWKIHPLHSVKIIDTRESWTKYKVSIFTEPENELNIALINFNK